MKVPEWFANAMNTAQLADDIAAIETAGMQADGGLAWLQAGHLLSDGTPAPEWMQELNGYTIAGAADKIRAMQCPECKGLGGATRRLPAPHVGSHHIDCPHCKGTGQKPTT